VHIRVISLITHSPFCPPEDPRLASAMFPQKHWIVCLMRENSRTSPAEKAMYRLINLPLW
jgi:hypothetical protein